MHDQADTRLPPDAVLYAALDSRDSAWEGRAVVGVTSTGIFCRLTCPARTPKPENCRFFVTPAEAVAAGFRPCKRCRPLGPEAESDPVVRPLVEALRADPDARWSEARLVAEGYDPSTVRRAFRRHFGMTFLDLARQRRLGAGVKTLAAGGKVIEAQMDAGFASPSAFREAFARMAGIAPGALDRAPLLSAGWIETPLGAMIAVADARALHLLEFVGRKALPTELRRLHAAAKGRLGIGRTAVHDATEAQLAAFFEGRAARFTVPLALHGTPFSRRVWEALCEIPAGETRSYSELARTLGRADAVRAVARANGANQIALIVPCHRVIGADGSLTGYGGGLWRKQRLIEFERRFSEEGGNDPPGYFHSEEETDVLSSE
ncbi:bifunctional transcriptional activator/DNA repair enzyme AdaA [Acidimangrovimonas sediminis]|uniref:bifunctional transcriptional activator/DNA repair enzyme AdaA n=1 Tax=Acidimangrovimonas sediminis TaxID=2056283 RepID=UPI000C8038B9|nr:trifunctional transcriptional activator/DNA repair protein Ada/methylated-DNA--[protein]-cysteine S-methyltransferase [Acidimangrovimonas sediminis]